ncbi:hypothetical protein B0H14DRAFT_2641235 [Mycena olivaceomarginata]|nr:hypothetical protein B0H14DRAFT_2641235 [Mycena olivaceomarginata]
MFSVTTKFLEAKTYTPDAKNAAQESAAPDAQRSRSGAASKSVGERVCGSVVDTCRDKAAQRAQNKWEAAAAVDLRYCMVGRHRVEVAACTSEGQVYASCNECRAIRRDQYAAVTGAAAQADVGNGEDTLGNDDANGGVQVDEYNAFFGMDPT